MEEENYIELLKMSLEGRDMQKTSDYLLKLFEQDENNFKKSIMLGGILTEPSSFNLNKDIYKFDNLKESFNLLLEQVEKRETKININFIKQLAIIIKGYDVLVNHNISNENHCNKCEFINFNKAKQLQMWCIFIEDQMRLTSTNIDKTIKGNGVYTGIESIIPMSIEGNERSKLSANDTIESYMELADEIFRFVFYIHRKDIKEYVDISCVDSYPYMVPSFEQIIYLTNHRVMLKKAWERFKYRGWNLRIDRSGTDRFYCFEPQEKDKFKKEGASIQRIGYNALQKSLETAYLWKIFDYKLKFVLQKTSRVALKDVFNIDKEYLSVLMEFYSSIIKAQMVFTLKFYGDDLWKIEIQDNINLKVVFDTMNYLYSIASLYIEKAYESTDFNTRSDYYRLAPIIDKLKLATQLSKVLDISEEIALKCINIFTFKPLLEKKQIALDIFSQPLVYVSEEQVIFTPSFIMQMNTERIIDKLLGAIDYNLSDKGYRMEKVVNELIAKNEYINVNENKIKFKAFDEKDVEFDCIAVFEGKLVIMEMKCRTAPYDEKEKNDKEAVLHDAVEQVKRRVKAVQNDWEEIKKRSSIKLMESPPKESDIIKIACFNFFNFTGQVIDGVYITDYSAITKYFNSHIDYANISSGNSIKKIPVKNIWEGKKPTVENLLNFLEMPSMMKDFYDNTKLMYKPIIRIEEENESLAVLDHYLEKNPYEEYFELAINENKKHKNTAFQKNRDKKRNKKSKKIIKRKKNKSSKLSRKLKGKK